MISFVVVFLVVFFLQTHKLLHSCTIITNDKEQTLRNDRHRYELGPSYKLQTMKWTIQYPYGHNLKNIAEYFNTLCSSIWTAGNQ